MGGNRHRARLVWPQHGAKRPASLLAPGPEGPVHPLCDRPLASPGHRLRRQLVLRWRALIDKPVPAGLEASCSRFNSPIPSHRQAGCQRQAGALAGLDVQRKARLQLRFGPGGRPRPAAARGSGPASCWSSGPPPVPPRAGRLHQSPPNRRRPARASPSSRPKQSRARDPRRPLVRLSTACPPAGRPPAGLREFATGPMPPQQGEWRSDQPGSTTTTAGSSALPLRRGRDQSGDCANRAPTTTTRGAVPMLGQITQRAVRPGSCSLQQAGLLQPTQKPPTGGDSGPRPPADVFAHQLNLIIRPVQAVCQPRRAGRQLRWKGRRIRFRRWISGFLAAGRWIELLLLFTGFKRGWGRLGWRLFSAESRNLAGSGSWGSGKRTRQVGYRRLCC